MKNKIFVFCDETVTKNDIQKAVENHIKFLINSQFCSGPIKNSTNVGCGNGRIRCFSFISPILPSAKTAFEIVIHKRNNKEY